jgi:hypothetical protein
MCSQCPSRSAQKEEMQFSWYNHQKLDWLAALAGLGQGRLFELVRAFEVF